MKDFIIKEIKNITIVDKDGNKQIFHNPIQHCNINSHSESEPTQTLYDTVKNYEVIYSLLYSPTRVSWEPLEKQIIEIETSKLIWAKDKNSFFFIWGWPGPDGNEYTIKTYGKGWAFTKEAILQAWGEEKERREI